MKVYSVLSAMTARSPVSRLVSIRKIIYCINLEVCLYVLIIYPTYTTDSLIHDICHQTYTFV
jgi:hypothetical protein